MLTPQEKNLYNTYLYVMRTVRNKPFSPRKDFTSFKEEDLFHLKRIVNFLNKFPHIKPEHYFKAPFVLHETEDFYGLDFFSGLPAVKTYSIYMKQLQEKDPDSDDQIQFISNSLKFIGSYCMRMKIPLDQYPEHKTGVTYDWMKHVKNHEVSIYSLMEFSKIYEIIREVQDDEKELFLGEIGQKYYSFKDRYMKSENAKYLVQQGIKKIKTIIEQK